MDDNGTLANDTDGEPDRHRTRTIDSRRDQVEVTHRGIMI